MKNSFKLLILTVAATCASCTQENGKDFPYNVPQAYLEEASNIPAFWKATTREVNDFLQNYVRKGRYEFSGESGGGCAI